MSATQLELNLTEASDDHTRERPDTYRWCDHCEGWVLRTRWKPHDTHHWRTQQRQDTDGEETQQGDSDSNDEPMRVGAYFTVELNYSVEYRLKIPAWNKHQAKDLAEDLVLDRRPGDRRLVHTRTNEGRELFEDSGIVPDEFDPYGSERLYDAIQAADDDSGGDDA